MGPSVTVWRHRASVAAVGDSARTVLIDLTDPAHPPRILQGPAATVWQAVDGRRDLAALCEQVGAEFGLPSDEVTADVVDFLRSLADQGLIEEVTR